MSSEEPTRFGVLAQSRVHEKPELSSDHLTYMRSSRGRVKNPSLGRRPTVEQSNGVGHGAYMALHGRFVKPRGPSWMAAEQADLIHVALVQLGVAEPLVVGQSWVVCLLKSGPP